MPASTPVPAHLIAAVRRFNRRHTRLVGALDETLLSSPYSLPQVRVLYEIANVPGLSAADLTRTLGLDRGYLSRLIGTLEERGLVRRGAADDNAKRLLLALTDDGERTFAELDEASATEVGALLGRLDDRRQRELVGAMGTVERLLAEEDDARTSGADATSPAGFRLRGPEPGDLGWIVHRHGALYREEYGWDWRFEALVAGIVAGFVQDFRPERERCWIAERDGTEGGEIIGSVFVVGESDATAKLRLLYVEPCARGMHLGRTLVAECVAFARAKGYSTLTLWTNDVLVSARRLYEAQGFELADEAPHHSFGRDLIGQHWKLTL